MSCLYNYLRALYLLALNINAIFVGSIFEDFFQYFTRRKRKMFRIKWLCRNICKVIKEKLKIDVFRLELYAIKFIIYI